MRCFLIFILLFFGFPNLSMGYFYDMPIWKQINKLTCTGEVRWACVDESCKKTDQSKALWEIKRTQLIYTGAKVSWRPAPKKMDTQISQIERNEIAKIMHLK